MTIAHCMEDNTHCFKGMVVREGGEKGGGRGREGGRREREEEWEGKEGEERERNKLVGLV